MACDPNTLLNDARCFTCLTEEQRAIINLYLLCQISGNTTPVVPINPVASGWAARVVVNGGALPSNATVLAFSNFLYCLDAAGLTSKMIAVNCFAPDSLIAAITPLIVGPGFDPWTNSGFLAAALTIDGLIGNNSNTLNSGIIPTRDFTSDADCGITLYNMSAINESTNDVGSNSVTNLRTSISNNTTFACWSSASGDTLSAANPSWTGYLSANRHGVNTQVLYRAKSTVPHAVLGTRSALASTRPAFVFFVFGGPTVPCARRLSFVAFHHGLTTAESSLFFNCVQAMRTAIGGGFL
jgi:hypothetical protein